MNKLSFLVLSLVVFGALLVGAPRTASAQTQPARGAASLHPHTVTLPNAWYRGEMKFQLAVSDTVAWADTLVVPGYDSTCTVHLTRVSKPARKPGLLDNHPWITHEVQARGKLILHFQQADTATFNVAVRKPY